MVRDPGSSAAVPRQPVLRSSAREHDTHVRRDASVLAHGSGDQRSVVRYLAVRLRSAAAGSRAVLLSVPGDVARAAERLVALPRGWRRAWRALRGFRFACCAALRRPLSTASQASRQAALARLAIGRSYLPAVGRPLPREFDVCVALGTRSRPHECALGDVVPRVEATRRSCKVHVAAYCCASRVPARVDVTRRTAPPYGY
jgi:hypothetical protein